VATTIPVPIEFSLPEGWRSVPPDEVGAPEAAFVALHLTAVHQGFTANIAVSGEVRPDDVPLTQLADESLARLRSGAREVVPGRRNEVGTPENPGLTQVVRMFVDLDGATRDIVQFQVFLGFRAADGEHRRAVLQIVLSALPEQFEEVIDDFHKFIATIRPEGA
jgi:hypothetical protein